jgi:hypothetical protein
MEQVEDSLHKLMLIRLKLRGQLEDKCLVDNILVGELGGHFGSEQKDLNLNKQL